MSKPTKGKRFVYKLESLLKVRRIREKQEQEKFEKAEQLLRAALQKEEALKNQRVQEYANLQEMLSTGDLPDLNLIKIRKIHITILGE